MVRYAYWAATLLFIALIGTKFEARTGFTSLIRFGETWRHAELSSVQSLPVSIAAHSNGYDGQFYAQLALDPLLHNPELDHAIDAPAYRAHRILLPAIAALLGAGNAWWTLQVYALLNVVAWVVLGWLMRNWISGDDWTSFARWTGCMFGMGILESVRQSLVDLPALLFLALAIRSYAQTRPLSRNTLWLALGNLTKETSVIGAIALNGLGLRDNQQRQRSILSLAIAILPIVIWWIYVEKRFAGAAAGEGLGNLTWPFIGMISQGTRCVHELLRGNFDGRFSFGLLAIIGFLFQGATLWLNHDLKSAWWRVGAAYALLLPFLGLWVWSGYWAACRAVLPLTIAFNLLLPRNRAFWPVWAIGNLTMLHALWRFL
jgi:hypothetical protein